MTNKLIYMSTNEIVFEGKEERNKFIDDIANSLKNIAYYRYVYHNSKNAKDKYEAYNILAQECNRIDRYATRYYNFNNITKKEMYKLGKQIKRIAKIKYKKQLKQMIKAYKESD